MHFSKGDSINGVPVIAAPDIASVLYRRPEPLDVIAAILDRGLESVATDMAALQDAGFVDTSVDLGEELWLLRQSGVALSKARFSRPIKRATAERLLAGVVERAAQYNSTEGYLLSVDRLRVFGSYLNPAAERLGDLDIEVTVIPDVLDSQVSQAYSIASGRRFAGAIEFAGWPRTELRQLLRGGSKSIDLQDAKEGELPTEMVIVYDRSTDPRALARPSSR